MEFWIYFWIYTFSMVVIWGFFVIAKIHSLKFKNYQPKIVKLTWIINIVMITLTILWYLFIFILTNNSNTYTLENTSSTKWEIEEEISNFSNISEQDSVIIDNAWDNYY
jgi:hypothetical protein